MTARGLLLGLGAAAPIGPVNVEIVRRTLRGGFLAGFALGCGAVTIDVLYAILVSLSLRPAAAHRGVMVTLGLLGGGLLLYLGFQCFRSAAQRTDLLAHAAPTRYGAHVGYLTGLLMTSLNPMTLAFWFLAVPAAVSNLTHQPGRDLPWICLGVFAATFSWVGGLCGVLHLLRGRSQFPWIWLADLCGGILLSGFALLAIWRAARALLYWRALS